MLQTSPQGKRNWCKIKFLERLENCQVYWLEEVKMKEKPRSLKGNPEITLMFQWELN